MQALRKLIERVVRRIAGLVRGSKTERQDAIEPVDTSADKKIYPLW